MRTFILTLTILVGLLNIEAQIPYNQRYINNVFDEIIVENDVVYGNAPALQFPFLNENSTSPQDLLMDIYKPVGDSLELRPAVVCAHAGAFVSGTRKAQDMVAFCDSLAHRGYVTASIDYRLGMNVLNTASSKRAVYRGIQDGRTAIRFLKEFAADYGIDTNNIYFIGSSAGAYIVQHNLYMDTEAERPPETYSSPDLGCLDCSGNNYQHSGKANGLTALWGALEDTTFIIQSDNNPVFLVHGTADATVPFGYGSAFGNQTFPATYGSCLVAERLENLNKKPLKYFVEGQGHEFYGTNNGDWSMGPNQYWDTIYSETNNFFYNIHKPTAGFSVDDLGSFEFFDHSIEATSYYWDFGDGTFSTEQNPVHEYANYDDYTVTQFVRNKLLSWDTTSMIVSFWLDLPEINENCVNVFPNPANDYITIKTNGKPLRDIKIRDISGKVVFSIDEITEATTLSISNWKPGVYTMESEYTGILIRKKLIVL